MLGYTQQRLALGHVFAHNLVNAAHYFFITDLLTEEPAVEAKLIGVFVIARLHVELIDLEAVVIVGT